MRLRVILSKLNEALIRTPGIDIGDVKLSVRNVDSYTSNGVTWLQLNGQTYSQTTYPALFAAINTATLPDSRGRVIGIAGDSGDDGITTRNLFDKVGKETHTLTIDEMPLHSHTFSDTYNIQNSASGSGATATDEIERAESTSDAGGGQAHNNMQPTLFAGYAYVCAEIVSVG